MICWGNSLVVQWLGHHAFTAKGTGSIPCGGTKIPQAMKVKVKVTLRPHGLYSPWNSPDQNTGMGSCSLLQGIFPTQASNPGLQHCRWILYQLSHKGSPRILEWVAYPFSSRSSWLRNLTRVSCIEGGFFNNWATRKAKLWSMVKTNKQNHSPWKTTKTKLWSSRQGVRKSLLLSLQREKT